MARRNLKDFLSDDTLDLSLNDLQDVPVKEIAQFPKATSLDLSNNKLTGLSKSFSTTLAHLVKLDLARNELRELPKNFGCLVNLKHLDLYKNKLENLPLSFGNLKSLRWLDLKENPLETHWQQIVGPCLNAQDCKNAARNVVNIASMMSDEIDAEVRSQGRQKKESEEQEEREQAKRREKQREKKRRKNAAKIAEANHVKEVENGSLVGVEPVPSPVEELLPEPPPKTSITQWNLRSVLGSVVKGLVYAMLMMSVMLWILSFVNRRLYKEILGQVTQNSNTFYTSLFPGTSQKYHQQLYINLINQTKTHAFTIFSTSSKMLKTLYLFITTDPKFEIYLTNIIHIFLSLYVTICNFVSMCFNTFLSVVS